MRLSRAAYPDHLWHFHEIRLMMYPTRVIQRFDEVNMPKSGKAPFIARDDFQYALYCCKGFNRVRDQLMITMTHTIGLRSKELASLKIRDVFDSKWNIHHTIRLLAAYTKGEKYREVYTDSPMLQKALKEYIKERRARKWSCTPDSPLILSQKGGPFSANTMQRHLKRIYKRAGVRGSGHSGRRTFATTLIENGASVFDVQVLMGHASIATTQVYFSESPARLRKIMQNVK